MLIIELEVVSNLTCTKYYAELYLEPLSPNVLEMSERLKAEVLDEVNEVPITGMESGID